MTKVVISEFLHEPALAGLGAGITADYRPGLVSDRPALLATLADAAGLIVRNRTRVDADLLAAAPQLRVVGRLGVGLDNIDLDACAARGIIVHPASGANALSVAEYVIAASLQLVRAAFSASSAMIAGQWPREALGQGGEIAGRTLGLVGYGAIARLVAQKARVLEMQVLAFDPHLTDADVPLVPLDDLLQRSDLLSLHVPLTAATRHLIDAAALARMQPSAVLINSARGGVVDERALCDALRGGRLAGAALDVFEQEPLTAATAARFDGVPNLLLTPHIAGVTAEGNIRVSEVTIANVRRTLACN